MPRAHAIYASTSGNVEVVVEHVATLLQAANFECDLHRAEITPVEIITQNDLFVLATSTWEHGEINPFFGKLMSEMSRLDLHGKRAAFIGLGDKRYEPVLFCGGMEQLKSVFIKQGGRVIYDALKIDGEPYHQLDSVVKPWANQLIRELNEESN